MTQSAIILQHFKRLQTLQGVTAAITRGATTLSGVTIVRARTDSQALTTREATISADVQDILVSLADYGVLGEPAAGDKFVFTEAGQTVTVEARPPSSQEKCFYRWRGGEVFHVHGKVSGRV